MNGRLEYVEDFPIFGCAFGEVWMQRKTHQVMILIIFALPKRHFANML